MPVHAAQRPSGHLPPPTHRQSSWVIDIIAAGCGCGRGPILLHRASDLLHRADSYLLAIRRAAAVAHGLPRAAPLVHILPSLLSLAPAAHRCAGSIAFTDRRRF